MSNALLESEPRILPAIVTPLLPDGKLDVASTERLIEHLYRQGIGGLYVAGTTGEGIWLDPAFRRQLVEIACQMSRGRGQVIVHVGAAQAGLPLALAEHAARAGAHAISSTPPFVGGYSWSEIHAYYSELASRSPLPLVAYYIPGLTGQRQSTDELASLLSLPNVVGFKWSAPNLFAMQRLAVRLAADQILYNGPDEMLALGLQSGAHGGIGSSYNFMADLILQVYQNCRQGEFAAAIATQRMVNDILEPVLRYHNVAATKQVLAWQGLIDHATCAAPRASLTAAEQQQLRKALSATAIADTLIHP